VLGAIGVKKKVPRGSPLAAPPPLHSTRAPRQRPVGKVPHPKRVGYVRTARGGLGDLFAFFPDLPRVPRPRSRIVKRRLVR
jgi:hypothetical protein